MKRKHITLIAPPLAALALLLGMFAHRATYGGADDAAPYHDRVKATVDALPYSFDGWQGTDSHVPQAALTLIRPNAIIARRYVNQTLGCEIDLLVVQCRDARDMAGHYPPVCYPAHGWRADSTDRETWQADHRALEGMVYGFDRPFAGGAASIAVVNFILLPDGRTAVDMQPIRRIAADYVQHVYGAAQVQLLFHQPIDGALRDRVVVTFLNQLEPIIDTVWEKKTP